MTRFTGTNIRNELAIIVLRIRSNTNASANNAEMVVIAELQLAVLFFWKFGEALLWSIDCNGPTGGRVSWDAGIGHLCSPTSC
jgi:hypothetical protein